MFEITVIITTKNEAANILPCLDALHTQTVARERIEIILVDNNSTDDTVEISKAFIDKHFNLGPERSAQRNYGVEQASAPYVLYLDADMRLSETVIAECLQKVKDDADIVGLFVPEIVVGKGFWIKSRNFERSFYDATVVDAERFIKRSTFLELQGFDLDLCGPEDWDFSRRLGAAGKTALLDSPLYHDEGAFNFKKYLAKKAYYSKTMSKYKEKWQNDAIVQKQLGFYYRFLGIYIENRKWKKLLKHPLLTCGMYFLRFIVGITYLTNHNNS